MRPPFDEVAFLLPAGTPLVAARFSRAIPIHDPSLTEIVRRYLHVDTIARQNLDAVAAQPSRDMCQDNVSVIQLDGKRRAGEDLFDAAEDFQRRFLRR
jgi:hypothetical protein